MPTKEEDEFMDQVCKAYTKVKVQWLSNVTSGPEHYAEYCRPFVHHVQRALVKLAGRPVSQATAYNLMARVGTRRFDAYHASRWTSYCEKEFPLWQALKRNELLARIAT